MSNRSAFLIGFALSGLLGATSGTMIPSARAQSPEGISPSDLKGTRDRLLPLPILPPAPAEEGTYALEILAVGTDGSVRLQVGCDPADEARKGRFLSFTAFRLRPSLGDEPGEDPLPAGHAVTEAKSCPARVALFQKPSRPPVPGPYRLEMHRVREGMEEDAVLAVAEVWRGSIADWIRAFEEERTAADRLFEEWHGDGHPDDYRALSRVAGFRFFDSPRFLHDVYRAEDREAQSRRRVEEFRLNPAVARAGDGSPNGTAVSLGGVLVRGTTASSGAAEPPPGAGASAPAAPAAPAAKADGGNGVRPGPSAPLQRVRERFARETLANLLLTVESWGRQTAALGADADAAAGEWKLLWDYHHLLTGQSAALRRLSETVELARFAAEGPSSPPSGTAREDLGSLARQARRMRLRISEEPRDVRGAR